MKKVLTIVALGVAVFATDYSTMSITDLQAMRGSVPSEDKAAFQSAMQTKMQALTPDERSSYQSTMQQSRSGSQDGAGSQMRQGGGSGMGGGMHRGGR